MTLSPAPAPAFRPPARSAAPVLRRCACGGKAEGGGECAECRKKRLQRSPSGSASSVDTAPPAVHDVLRSPGQPLDGATRAFMEPRFGHSFANVRVHADERSAESASAVGARAYAVGHDVVFGRGMYSPASAGGQRLIAHELAHVVQQSATAARAVSPSLEVGAVDAPEERQADAAADIVMAGGSTPVDLAGGPAALRRAPVPAICFQPGATDTPAEGECSPRDPDRCPTYQDWLRGFEQVRRFNAPDVQPPQQPGQPTPAGFDVLGAGPASEDPSAAASQRPPTRVGEGTTDRFIDHPTDEWVRTCLPENLRQDAYQLPADCADVAVILRHVWLSAHHRTETFGRWTIGDGAGAAARDHVGQVINEVYSGNVGQMVSPYADAQGRPLRTFAALAPLLHEGDVLVWEHHTGAPNGPRSGGHTQTITRVTRNGATVDSLGVVQGNQPLDATQAAEIARRVGPGAPDEHTVRNWAGRRIEHEELAGGMLGDVDLPLPPHAPAGTQPQQVWSDDGTTTLVAAGPPRSAPRPLAQLSHGRRTRQLSDWLPALRTASRARLPGTFEAALQELRAAIEGGGGVSDADSAAIGQAAGERLWALAHAAGGLGEDEHFRPLQEMLAVISSLATGGSSAPALLEQKFGVTANAFGDAARGGTTISFTRPPAARGTNQLKMLVTGFDPFVDTGSLANPQRGEWNPSGAAAIALDGTTVDGPGRVRTAVEGIVLPVSFTEFNSGIVERLVPVSQVDAVITVSLEPTLDDGDPVRLERYAVGVRDEANDDTRLPVPAAPGGELGAAILPSAAPIDEIARDARQPGAPGHADVVAQPTTGDEVTFRFASAAEADAALTALGQPPQGVEEVNIPGPAAMSTIVASMTRSTADPTRITFTAGGAQHTAQVRDGPGKSFLSNEVSYRVLRMLAAQGGSQMSFHVHTPGSGSIPQDTSTPAARATRSRALADAGAARTRLIGTLRRVIRATAGRIVARRAASTTTPGTP